MPMIPFGIYAPDVTTYNAKTTALAQNVMPRGDGYMPFKSFARLSSPLAEGNDSFTKILLHCNGTDASTTFTDSNTGGSAHTWTAAGNAQIDTADSKFGGASGLFDGTGDWITTPDHADFTLGSGDFTFECWFKCTAAGGTQIELGGQCDNSAGTASTSIRILRLNTNVMCAFVAVGAVLNVVQGTTQFTNAVNTGWHHLALTKSGTTARLFIDGIKESGDVTVSGTVNDSSNKWGIGTPGDITTGNPWNGWLDEIRLSVGIARWTSNFSPSTKAYDLPANGTCRGLFYARKSDGSIVAFAGTINKLFRLDNTALDWVDVTPAAGYTNLPNSAHWQFAQFGNFVIAVQPNVVPQAFDITSSTVFAALGGSPPQASYVSVVGKFLVLSGLNSTPYRIQWSGLNAITTWTSGVNSSDFQDFPDGGIVRGVAGGEYGVIFQDSIIRSMIYAVGASYVFQITKIAEDKGLLAPYSIIRSGERTFFIAQQGFHVIVGTGYPQQIGKEKIDRTFFNDYDKSALQLIIGAADPEGSRVFWGYKSGAGASGLIDKMLCYDYSLDQPSIIAGQAIEYLATLAAPGATLESLDVLFPNIDLMTISLDDFALSQLPHLAAFNSAHTLGLFSGPNLEATLETPERALDDRRVRIQGARPNTDAPTCFISIGARESQQAAVAYTTEQPVNVRGFCPANISTRLARARTRIPAGVVWSFASGVEPLFRPSGRR